MVSPLQPCNFSCDVMSAALPSGYDVFLLANLIHYWSPHDNRALLQRVRTPEALATRALIASTHCSHAHIG